MSENELWEIESIDLARTKMTLKKGNSKLELYVIMHIPPKWAVGDQIEYETRNDAKSDIVVKVSNKTKGGAADAHVIQGSGDELKKSLGDAKEWKYPNLNKDLLITKIKLPDMTLSDHSEWNFPKGMMPPPSGWVEGDTVNVEHTGRSLRPGEKQLAHKIINISKEKQEGHAYLMNFGDENIMNMSEHTMAKSRKGTVDTKCPSDIEIVETDEDFSDEWLGQKWGFGGSYTREGQSNESEAYYITVETPDVTVWKLKEGNPGSWETGNAVRIHRSKSRMGLYDIENLDKKDSRLVTVSFAGWIK